MSETVAQQLVTTLTRAGVERVYGLPGDSLNGFTDALRRDGGLAWVHVRHEEAAAFAASAEAALTGDLAVCAASCGPGNLHLINGLYDANRSRVPVLAIAAHIPSAEIGGSYFQETHPQDLFRECSVYCELVSSPEQLPRVAEMAMRAAIEQRGVAVLVVPGDVLEAKAHDTGERPAIRPTQTVARPADLALDAAAAALNQAERPAILAGAGCEGAHAELVALAGALKAPIVHTLRGKEHVEYDNPYDVGMTGLLGISSGYRALEHCDVLVMLGTDLPYRQFYPEDATVIQVDTRGEHIGRRVPVDLPLVGTVKDTIDALLPRLIPGKSAEYLERMQREFAKAQHKLGKLESDATPMHPETVAGAIDALAADDAIFIPDVGTPVIWAARHLHMNGRRRLIGSFNHGSMANALAQAIGAQASHPGRQVVALSGDGGLAMLLGDLITLRQNQLPAKIVVFNNGSLGFVELEMKAAGIVNFGTELENPDFAAVATALGLYGQRVSDPAGLQDALRAAFAYDGPALVEVMVARQELSLPPTITREQVKGFALWGARTVLSGRGDELIDLAHTNPLRRLLG
ncbi:ubiquinone-dependent pyruvate dehydrogenase [Solirubrobacter phytolaccae]|uniref:Pyruvate dehydrogenase [ubiquinone] n=1 Tax=Solirubrobacter phytolaccae TaxID=1404360 RepID=A0A9X3N372_9ACTN|nr:ubiquinone-dependent pyruvate dehydrogenase [Solirubrobacter phytolaccae]MDA0178754.1 ubiquinone-dependent pyruvate dehydrogenase [Solirubrobacter phytolaccae]